MARNSLGWFLQIQTWSSAAIFGSLAARCNSLHVSGRPGLILATEIASESEVRWTEGCTSSFHLNPSSCRISCFLYVRAFLASIDLRCASEFGLHWRNRIVVVVIDGLPMTDWLLHYNAPAILDTLLNLSADLRNEPPDLAPSDYHLISEFKETPSQTKIFNSGMLSKSGWRDSQNFYFTGIEKLCIYQMCIDKAMNVLKNKCVLACPCLV